MVKQNWINNLFRITWKYHNVYLLPMNEHQFGGEHDEIATTISDVVQEWKPP